MRKIILLLTAFVLFSQLQTRADEGMWLLTLLKKNYSDMKKQGFKLTPEDIYSLNKASIKDAVVIFGRGCTAEIVSEKGLLLTNHHCGYGAIQSQSSVEHNYLRDGFWAKDLKEELPIPGLSVRFFIRIEDVSDKINKELNDKMTEEERDKKVAEISKDIENSAAENGKYIAQVRSFFNGNNFYLVIYEIYNDVRLVGTPPEMIGKFGYDTDNWVWPRHTGDFSVFRVYMGPDGKPAEYAENNVPLKPKYSLPVSVKGYKKGDFTMILGFPGSTDRYMTSHEIDELMGVINTNRIKIRGVRQDLMMEDMKVDEKIRIQYSSKYSSSSNYWKNSIGMNRGLSKLNVKAKKQATETEFTKWVNADNSRKAKYGGALALIEKAVNGRGDFLSARQYISETMTRGIEIIGFANRVGKMLDKPEKIKENAKEFFKDYNKSTDQKIAVAMVKLFMADVKPQFYPEFIRTEITGKFAGDVQKYVDDLYANSLFANEKAFMELMNNFDKAKLENDPAFTAATTVYTKSDEIGKESEAFDNDLAKGRRLFLAGLMEMKKDKNFYPDANFTMRLTYGTIGDYKARDAVVYDYYTTLDGVMEKEIPGDFEFDVPARLKELWKKKDYGIYGQDGKMFVCFTSNNDITGGNSGSPIMNGNGELLGLAFDGNWEAMSGDIAFEPELQKTINVDIRYVLWIMDKYGNAKHLVDEMKIIK